MEDLVESIRANGILSPVLIRPIGNDVYEMVSGHRRMHAAILLGMDRIPAIIREMSDDEAIVKMVDANIQREELLPSEKAFAYKMKMDAMRRQAGRPTKDNSRQIVGNYETADIVGKENGESGRQVQRFIRLTELIPELLEYVDQKRLQFTVAVEISYIDKEVQKWLYEYIKDNGMVRLNQVVLLRAQMKTGAITQAKMISMLNNSQPGKGPATKLTFSEKKLREFFPAHYTSTQMRDVIEDLLSDWKHKQDFEELNGE
jgi:ParB family chromosome partitioning protein